MKTDLFLFSQIYTDFFLRLAFSNLRKSAKSVDDTVFLVFHANVEAWLVAREWRQQMREQLIADLLPLNYQLSTINCFSPTSQCRRFSAR